MIFEPVKIGIIGCEGYAFQLIKRIKTVPNSGVITAVVALDINSSGAKFCHANGMRVFQSVKDFLQSGLFEVVMNPTPIHLHAHFTKTCLAAGFPVWLEKPPVATVQEWEDVRLFAEKSDLRVAVCFNSLFSQLTQNLKADLIDGRFGEIRQIKGIGAWPRSNEYFSRNNWAGRLSVDDAWVLDGPINNPFAHVLCNNLYFASPGRHSLAEASTIEAELYRCNPIESEDTSCLRIQTETGVEIINYLTLTPNTSIDPRTVIETEKALITYSNFSRISIQFHDGSAENRESYCEDRIEMIQHLCRAFRTGEDYLSTLQMMRPFTLAVNGAFESAGTIETIPDAFIKSEGINGTQQLSINNIDNIMEDSFRSNSLYSELGVPWSKRSKKFNLTGYDKFPVKFESSVVQ